MLSVLLALRGMRFPDDSKNFIRVIRSDRGFSVFALEFKLDEFGFFLPFCIDWEPVIEVLRRDAPTVIYSLGIEHGNGLYF